MKISGKRSRQGVCADLVRVTKMCLFETFYNSANTLEGDGAKIEYCKVKTVHGRSC